jgi:glutamate-ammonia-ligase adenylyltransferase
MSVLDIVSSSIDCLPEGLRQQTHTYLQRFSEKFDQQTVDLQGHPDFISSIATVFSCSQFVAESCIKNPDLIIDLMKSGRLYSRDAGEDYQTLLRDQSVEKNLAILLRKFRGREMVRIAWRDLAGWAELDETLADVSALAETCIQYALDQLYKKACELKGTPTYANGSELQLVVLGMGKLGAWELNYSSDIDLIFCYPEDGVLSDRKNTSYGEFFARIGQQLVKALDEITVDGFVFRTDIRLRPFGDSGPIVMTFDGMENYYQTQAREWERYAMIKVRPVAGDIQGGQYFMEMIKPFVYRRYLDYGAFEELRSLKFQITQELQRKDRLENIKLGPGGIREIEFIGQAFQLIRGGAEKKLQERRILKVLGILGEMELLTKADAEQLQGSYRFLRKAENHIQQYQDRQTHDLSVDESARLSLAFSMGFSDWDAFKHVLDSVRQQVHEVFGQVFAPALQEEDSSKGKTVWVGKADQQQLVEYLQNFGYKKPEESYQLIEKFKSSSALQKLTTKGAGVVDRLMPQLIEAVPQVDNPEQTLQRTLTLLEAVAGRNVYLALLAENSDALAQLIKLSSASPWICDYLSRYPVLFDELLDTRSLYDPLDKEELSKRLQQKMAGVDGQDIEQVMNTLRKFKQISMLHVAAADIMGVIPVMKVSDYLTTIAEVILDEAVVQVWQSLTAKHGLPSGVVDSVTGFAVIGLGKLGGLELGYGSDLDLVFLYDCLDGNALTDGKKPISSMEFYGRLGQKVMSMLNTNLLSGILYEVDMRLRPSGKSGLLVTHVNAYETYMEKDAWTWEHQALVRGRFVAGDILLQDKFIQIREKILAKPRDYELLKTEVREMREKMRSNSPNLKNDFDLKQSKGGIADIEFIVQFGILALASENHALLAYTDNVRLLEGLQEQGFISEATADLLKAAYHAFRDRGHKEVLQGNQAVVGTQEYSDMRTKVEQVWHELMD